jgi:hypothetical protein
VHDFQLMVPPTVERIEVEGESVSTDVVSEVIAEEQLANVTRTKAVTSDLRST